MRFGKTFTSYQVARKLGATRVLVATFKPAVEDAWQTDIESHADFDGWLYLSRNSDSDPTSISASKPLVYFGSFQDFLGRDDVGNIKPQTPSRQTMPSPQIQFPISNGEAYLSAVESANTVTRQFIGRNDMRNAPVAEIAAHYIIMGLDGERSTAMRKAILASTEFLKENKKVNFSTSLALRSVGLISKSPRCSMVRGKFTR